jgi:hypothetical protein
MLVVELVKLEDNWLFYSDVIGNKPQVGLGCFDRIVAEKERVRWRVLVVVRIPIHGQVDFSG